MNSPALQRLLAAALATLLAGCASHPATGPRAACCAPTAPVASATFTEQSLFRTEAIWTEDTGRTLRLGNLAGRPLVVAMFFASCQFTCPVIVNDLRRIEAALDPTTRARVGFVLVSFDSRRDTPAALAAYRESRALPRPGWTLLRGEPDDVQELAALLGVSFRADARGDFAHSNQITVLNADGEIVQRLEGLNRDVAGTVRRLTELARAGTDVASAETPSATASARPRIER